jgi:hypothetical protein
MSSAGQELVDRATAGLEGEIAALVASLNPTQ